MVFTHLLIQTFQLAPIIWKLSKKDHIIPDDLTIPKYNLNIQKHTIFSKLVQNNSKSFGIFSKCMKIPKFSKLYRFVPNLPYSFQIASLCFKLFNILQNYSTHSFYIFDAVFNILNCHPQYFEPSKIVSNRSELCKSFKLGVFALNHS